MGMDDFYTKEEQVIRLTTMAGPIFGMGAGIFFFAPLLGRWLEGKTGDPQIVRMVVGLAKDGKNHSKKF